MPTEKLKIHFIGIGGIGVSALAKYYLAKGHKISGSDLVSSEITKALKKSGAKIYIGKHEAKNLLRDVDFVIYSPAISLDNPELKAATVRGRTSNIEILSYPQALGELTKKYFTIAVSGTHGKSTIAAMIGLILAKAGLDPTVIIGTKLKEFTPHQKNGGGSNCRVGESKYLVIEADEHMASFLNYWPKIIVLTNIEKEHLDYYKNLKNILKTYKEYISHLPEMGVLVANKDDKNIRRIIRARIFNVISREAIPIKRCLYSIKKKEAKKLKKILKVPGEHNVSNALAVLTVARVLKIPDKISFKALSEYKGSWRRFEIQTIYLNAKRYTLINDYAHHPTEIKLTLKAAREKFPKKEIWCVFQPHQYQRTYYLFKDFVKVFKAAPINRLIITDIYDVAGREKKKIKKLISSKKLVKAIKKNQELRIKNKELMYISTVKKVGDYLKKNLVGGEKIIIIMGAGDIYNLVIHLTEKVERKKIN